MKKHNNGSIDRISELPQFILHHILSLLSQKEAIQTCVLSKSWRYLGSTRPNIEFKGRSHFAWNKETYMSVLDKTLQRYHDQKLSVQEFVVWMSEVDSESASLLEKWIPIVILNMGVNKFDLSFLSLESAYFDLPSVVFKSASLEKLILQRCKLNQNSIDRIMLTHLQRLRLKEVYIADETLENIMSSCPLIDYLSLYECEGLKTIKVNKARNLKDFDFSHCQMGNCSIEINVPTIETISINAGSIWFHHHMYFSHLSSLKLWRVSLSRGSFDFLSCNCPNLEDLAIINCYGFQEFRLLSGSIKNLNLGMRGTVKPHVLIDAPNIVKFEYEGCIPQSLSFTTSNSSEWKSYIYLTCDVFDVSSWFVKLNEVVKALSQSEISLYLHIKDLPALVVPHIIYIGFDKPVVVEHLELSLSGYLSSPYSAYINDLFRICRPRNIGRYWCVTKPVEWGREHKLSEFQCQILLMEREGIRRYFWQHDLEEVSMEIFDENRQEWCLVRGSGLSEHELRKIRFGPKIRLRLKWRDLS